MPVATALSKREFRLLSISRDRTVERDRTSEIIFDRLVDMGLMTDEGRITEAGREALSQDHTQEHPSHERNAGGWKLGGLLSGNTNNSGLAGGLGIRTDSGDRTLSTGKAPRKNR